MSQPNVRTSCGRLVIGLAALCLLPLASGFTPGTPNLPEPLDLTFAVYTSDKATVMYRQFTPVIESLSENMERRIGRPVNIEIKILKTYDAAIEALTSGSIDFVRFGPSSYVISKRLNPKIELLAMESKKGKKRFLGAIVVRADSKIRQLSDLRGKRFAFGDERSTIGRYLSQAVLVEAGVLASDLAAHSYLGRHDKVVRAVEVGDVEAGAAKMGTVKKLNSRGKLRVLHTFENVTKPWVARAGLDPEVLQNLRQGLLDLEDEDALKQLKASGFIPTSDEEYKFVRIGMEQSEKFSPKEVSGGQDAK